MKIISLLVEGFERAANEGALEWLFGQNADIICLQDTRCDEFSLGDNRFFPNGYSAYFADNYSNSRVNGVAIYCKKMPKAVVMGLGFINFDPRGLYIQADYANVSIGSIYIPMNQKQGLDSALRSEFLGLLASHLQKIRNKRREFIICGGWGMIASPIDAEDAGNRSVIAGFGHEERHWLQTLFQAGYFDTFREINATTDEYSWWPEGDEAPGLRTDTQIASEGLRPKVDGAEVETDHIFSSHAPIIVNFDIKI